jgi:carotenoid 1,2-hydratase
VVTQLPGSRLLSEGLAPALQPASDLPLDVAVRPGGYAWWYLDVASEDGAFALSAIVFVGSVFSPRYARARARGAADAEEFCALSLSLHGPEGSWWVMSEWPRSRVRREAGAFTIGPSVWRRLASGVLFSIDELTSPFPHLTRQRVRGRVHLKPVAPGGPGRPLDSGGRHLWYPLSPAARAEVELDEPRARFVGNAYHDANFGHEPLADGFRRWSWCRLSRTGKTVVTYDLEPRPGEARRFAHYFGAPGELAPEQMPAEAQPLPRTSWGLSRRLLWPWRGGVLRELESGPFYARALVWAEGESGGRRWLGVHEELSLERFRAPWVRFLLPFRIRRVRA